MNEIQKHLIKLLQEIDETCTKNGIPYLLCGRTAKDACQSHHFLGEYVYATVMMRGQDFDKFRALVAKKEGRTVESIRENPDFPDGMAMRYVDETTTFIYGHTAHNYKHKGIYVTIQKCRKTPKNRIKAKLANGIDRGIAYAGVDDISGVGKKKRLVVKCLRLGIKLLGKPFVFKHLLNLQDRLIRSGGKKLVYVRSTKNNIKIPATMFTDVKRVELEGVEFLVPNDTETYLEKVYGKNWETDDKPENISSPHLLVYSTQVGYKEVDNDDSLYANRAQVNAVISKRKQLAAQIRPLRNKIEEYWDILFLTKERYRLYRKYMPVVEILEERLSGREYGWLEIAMQDYMNTVKTYLSKNLPMVICPALDNIVLEMLYYSGELTLAEKFKKLKSKVPLKGITMKLDERTQQEALTSLPATIFYNQENSVPVSLRYEEEQYGVAVLDEGGQAHPVLLKRGNQIVSAIAATVIDGEAASAWQLAVKNKDDVYVPLFGSEWSERLFGTEQTIPLIQHMYGQDLQIAWLDKNGRVYVAAQFDSCDRYSSMGIPEYLYVGEDMEVPVSFFDSERQAMRELHCMDDKGCREAVVTLGVGGALWVTPGAAQKLYYRDDAEQLQQLTVSCFADQAGAEVKQILGRGNAPAVCCKLVQKDAFGRVIEVAALYDDGSIRPLVRANADGSLSKLEPVKQSYATFCLKQSDGTDIPLAVVDSEGNVVSSVVERKSFSLQAILGGIKA